MKHNVCGLMPLRASALALFLLVPMSASAQRSVPVTVVNPESRPVPVLPQGMEGVPVQENVVLVVPADESSASADLYDAPEGKVLIIEYLTLVVDSRGDEQAWIVLQTGLGGETGSHFLGPLPPPVLTGLGSGKTITLQRNLRAYSDGIVRFYYTRGTGFTDERAIIQVSVTGRLVDAPLP
jgi:hypothetical protein